MVLGIFLTRNCFVVNKKAGFNCSRHITARATHDGRKLVLGIQARTLNKELTESGTLASASHNTLSLPVNPRLLYYWISRGALETRQLSKGQDAGGDLGEGGLDALSGCG